MRQTSDISTHVRPIMGTIRSVPFVPKTGLGSEPAVLPFITISRQPGAGAWTVARQLVDHINQSAAADQQWRCWDRELIEKVANDHHLSQRLIESIEDQPHPWLVSLLESLSFNDNSESADEEKVYRRVALTIRALAHGGRVVIVGRGGVFITRKMPGGIHIRLVAPLEERIATMARELKLTAAQAAASVRELEHNRKAFYRRYWPNETMDSDLFTLTLNTAAVELPTMVDLLARLVHNRTPVLQ